MTFLRFLIARSEEQSGVCHTAIQSDAYPAFCRLNYRLFPERSTESTGVYPGSRSSGKERLFGGSNGDKYLKCVAGIR